MIFAFVLLFVTLAVLGTVLSPLWQRGRRALTRGRYDRAVYRDQLAEIERDVARGIVRPEDAAAARREIERRG
ncbi:MAG: c-type cytochrome biogenesis protein CcmI, partial [Stellaceae bacterium]